MSVPRGRHSRNSDSPRGELSELNRLLFFLRSAAFASTFVGTRMARFFLVRYRSFAPFVLLVTVAQARCSASFLDAPRFS